MEQDLPPAEPANARRPLRASILLVPLLVLGASQMTDVTSAIDVTSPAWSAATTVLVVGVAASYTAGAMVAASQRPVLPTPLRPRLQAEEKLGILARVDGLADDPRQVQHPTSDPEATTKPYDGPRDLEPRTVDLGRLVRRTVGCSRSRAQAAGVELSVVVLQDPPVLADPDRLAQALTEVLSHAIGQTPGGSQVRVTLDAPDGVARLRVTHKEAGLSQDEGVHELTSLGLTMARRVTEDHAGTLTNERSALGRRTTLNLRLPILPPARDPGEVC